MFLCVVLFRKKIGAQPTLSNALRREVITFITAGLVTVATAWETNKKNTDPRNTLDDDFDDDSFDPNYNYREDTETHPALQMFQCHSDPHAMQKFASASGVAAGIKQKFTGLHGKANSYAGFLLDNNWNRKISKSRERSTDGMYHRHIHIFFSNHKINHIYT